MSSPKDRSPVRKATRILIELGGAHTSLTLSELARRTGLPKTTVHRLMSILLADRLVRRSDNGYQLGPVLTQLASMALAPRLRRRLLPHLVNLYELTHQTVGLAVLRGEQVVFVERIHGHPRAWTPYDDVDVVPAWLTAAGRLLMAYEVDSCRLPDDPNDREMASIRAAGMAHVDETLVHGAQCVAVPVTGKDGRPVAAVTVSAADRTFDPRQAAPAMRRAAHAMALELRVAPSLAGCSGDDSAAGSWVLR